MTVNKIFSKTFNRLRAATQNLQIWPTWLFNCFFIQISYLIEIKTCFNVGSFIISNCRKKCWSFCDFNALSWQHYRIGIFRWNLKMSDFFSFTLTYNIHVDKINYDFNGIFSILLKSAVEMNKLAFFTTLL